MTKAQFLAACKKQGFKPEGFMGYFALPTGLRVSVLNTNTERRRTWLAFLIKEHANDVARRERDGKAEVALREAGCVIEKRGKEHGWWHGDRYLDRGYSPADALAALKKIKSAK
jgi:hypothetical protein